MLDGVDPVTGGKMTDTFSMNRDELAQRTGASTRAIYIELL
jgi:hypothetical protein